jgi:hypothetical protein
MHACQPVGLLVELVTSCISAIQAGNCLFYSHHLPAKHGMLVSFSVPLLLLLLLLLLLRVLFLPPC